MVAPTKVQWKAVAKAPVQAPAPAQAVQWKAPALVWEHVHQEFQDLLDHVLFINR